MLRVQKVPMTFTFEVSNGLYSLTRETEACFDRKSLLYAGKVVFAGLADYFAHYHCDIAEQSSVKVLKLKDSHLSFSINLNSCF
jgi:hypothetical protein